METRVKPKDGRNEMDLEDLLHSEDLARTSGNEDQGRARGMEDPCGAEGLAKVIDFHKSSVIITHSNVFILIKGLVCKKKKKEREREKQISK